MNIIFLMFKNYQQTELELQQQLLARTVANMWLGKEKEITRNINDEICPLYWLLFIFIESRHKFHSGPYFLGSLSQHYIPTTLL